LVTVNFLAISGVISETVSFVAVNLITILITLIGTFSSFLIVGTITWIVTQNMAVPLRPISLRAALVAAKGKWRSFAWTGMFSLLFSAFAAGFVGVSLLIISLVGIWLITGLEGEAPIFAAVLGAVGGSLAFLTSSVALMLIGPSLMMENIRGIKAVKRSIELVRRSPVTALNAFVIMFLVPVLSAALISAVLNLAARRIDPSLFEKDTVTSVRPNELATADKEAPDHSQIEINLSTGTGAGLKISNSNNDVRKRLKYALLETMLQILLLPLQILTTSFTAIIVALLYLKTRQVGGESLQSLLYHFEESGRPRKRWQERVKRRLVQSGRISEKT
jgi:hypothetical protein